MTHDKSNPARRCSTRQDCFRAIALMPPWGYHGKSQSSWFTGVPEKSKLCLLAHARQHMPRQEAPMLGPGTMPRMSQQQGSHDCGLKSAVMPNAEFFSSAFLTFQTLRLRLTYGPPGCAVDLPITISASAMGSQEALSAAAFGFMYCTKYWSWLAEDPVYCCCGRSRLLKEALIGCMCLACRTGQQLGSQSPTSTSTSCPGDQGTLSATTRCTTPLRPAPSRKPPTGALLTSLLI